MALTQAEEQVMKHLWNLEKAYMKDILDEYPDPKPKPTTLATLLKRMIQKGFVGYNQHGNNREYFPLIRKETYFLKHLSTMVKDFFNDSASQFASFFASESDMSLEELEALKAEIEERIKKRQ
ncbi:MAG: BlaI/MecI/CopY family transcriptional regulator [Anaerolineales bacterium]